MPDVFESSQKNKTLRNYISTLGPVNFQKNQTIAESMSKIPIKYK